LWSLKNHSRDDFLIRFEGCCRLHLQGLAVRGNYTIKFEFSHKWPFKKLSINPHHVRVTKKSRKRYSLLCLLMASSLYRF
jgi:hypothetical protein